MSYTLPEFLAHAIAMEEEAAERYLELADMMESHRNDDVSALFRDMHRFSLMHRDAIRGRVGSVELPKLKSWQYRWRTPPEMGDDDAFDYMIEAYNALRYARANEVRAMEYYRSVAGESGDAEVKRLAADGWRTDGLPELGREVDVETASGHMLRGTAIDTDGFDEICLRGEHAGPHGGDANNEWATWPDTRGGLASQRVRWRYIDEPARKQPKPLVNAPRLASGRAERPEPPGGCEGWETDGLPELGREVEVRTAAGEVLRGAAYVVSGDSLTIAGPHALPSHMSSCDDRWMTWSRGSGSAHHRRVGWRYADRAERPEPEPSPLAAAIAEITPLPEPAPAMLGPITAVELAACLLRLRATCTDPGARAWAQRLAMTIDP